MREGSVFMDKEELENGMKDAKKESGKKESGGKEGGGWSPSLDWVIDSVGPFFNNNKGIGELLLDQLNSSGINTERIALAGMVDVLKQFSREYKELGQILGDNLSRIEDLSDQSDDLAQAIRDLVKEMGGSSEEAPQIPTEDIGADVMADAGAPPPDTGAGGDMGAAPPDMGAGGDMGAPPPDMGGGMDMGMDMGGMPPDMGGGMDMGAPPLGAGGGMDMGGMPPDMGGAPPAGVPSDEGVKNVKKYVLSDEQLKSIAGRLSSAYRRKRDAGSRTRFSSGMISACARSDL